MSGAKKKDTTVPSTSKTQYKVVKLPGITKITNLRKKWNVNMEAIKERARRYIEVQPPQMDRKLETVDIIKNNNYPVEPYELTTTDGYFINIFRIPHGALNKSTHNRRSLLLVHGLLSCSDDWVKSGPENGLGYILAEEGYDVWLANCRGTRYSNRHTQYSQEDSKFWNFTLHEMALYDISAMIDFILIETGKSKLYYVGYCQGTTLSYILCSERPEYNKKIALNIGLAPIAYAKNMQCPIIKIIGHLQERDVLGSYFSKKNYEVQELVRRKSSKFIDCKGSNFDILCLNNMFVSFGYNPQNLLPELLPILFNNDTDSPASMKQFLHYSQLCKSGKFCRFDYGDENEAKYCGARSPPEYKVENVTCPIVIYVSEDDWISRIDDALAIKAKFTKASVTIFELTSLKNYTHLDFLYGSNVSEQLYLPIMQQLAAVE